ncbi:uncharacterized protein LOC123272100 [Cotesia glomerata]|uniref:UPAR/Ly6 domain-containing protein n=1 Tax=Cotesia glomerata TaxID=32391 RepID=A0AAV7JA37_COTGL|nr:uncharacterized protein LOC123272100 [Cotesia glomerata]KAH0568164.1 hypothetical protein KQX54_019207 [Cotesia glomerata]
MKYLIFFGVIAAVFVSGQCLKCFECYGDKCNDGSTLKNEVNCTGNDQMCFKQIIYEHAEKKVQYNRGCFVADKINEKVNLTNTISTEVYFCKKENCNGVGSFTGSLSIVLVTLVALMFAGEKW